MARALSFDSNGLDVCDGFTYVGPFKYTINRRTVRPISEREVRSGTITYRVFLYPVHVSNAETWSELRDVPRGTEGRIRPHRLWDVPKVS